MGFSAVSGLMVGVGHQGKLLALALTAGMSLMDWSSFLSKVRRRRSQAGPRLIGRDLRNNAVSRRLLRLAHDSTESAEMASTPASPAGVPAHEGPVVNEGRVLISNRILDTPRSRLHLPLTHDALSSRCLFFPLSSSHYPFISLLYLISVIGEQNQPVFVTKTVGLSGVLNTTDGADKGPDRQTDRRTSRSVKQASK